MTFEEELAHMYKCWLLDFLEQLKIKAAKPKDMAEDFDRRLQRGATFEVIE